MATPPNTKSVSKSNAKRKVATVPSARFFQNAYKGARKKIRTRALILDTAIELVSEKGIDRASIAEITQRAGISNGSFYYHFRDKGELLDAVGGVMAAIFVEKTDQAIADVECAVERVAVASQLFVQCASDAPEWGYLVARAMEELGEFREQILRGIQKDVLIGINQGLFVQPSAPAVFPMLMALIGAAITERLRDPSSNAAAGLIAAQIILRALGVSADKVEEVTSRVHVRLEQMTLDLDMDIREVIGDM